MCMRMLLILLFFQYFFAFCNRFDSSLCDLHLSLTGNVNLEVTCKETRQTTITVLLYTATSGGIRVGKNFDVQMPYHDN